MCYIHTLMVRSIPEHSGPYQVMNRLNDIYSIQDLVSGKVIDTSAPTFQLRSWQDSTSRHSTTDSSGISYTRYPSSSWWSKLKIHDRILGEMGRLWRYRVVGAICRTPTCRETCQYIRCVRWYLLNISNRVSNAGFFYRFFYPLRGFGR